MRGLTEFGLEYQVRDSGGTRPQEGLRNVKRDSEDFQLKRIENHYQYNKLFLKKLTVAS